MALPLTQQTVLITGASSGIGAALAQALAGQFPGIRLEQFAVNLFGPLALTRALIPTMRNQGGGRIINISSLGGRLAFPFVGVYSASKFALEALSDVLRMELDPFNIRVSLVEPGPVATEFVDVAKMQIDAAIPNPPDTPYRAAFQKVVNLDQQLARQAWSAEQVATAIVKALSDRHPRPRYIAATGSKLLLFVMSLLPTRLVNRFWQRFYGIDLVTKAWQSKTQSNP